MSNWPVFLTAENIKPKALNKAWLLLQDFEFSEPFEDLRWILLTSNPLPTTPPTPIPPPLPPVTSNSFNNLPHTEINTFVRANEDKFKELDLSSSNWCILDQIGLDTDTIIVCDQEYDEDTEEMSEKYNGVRLPYEVAWSLVCNLFISNMDFIEWVDEDAGIQEDGLWKWIGPFDDTDEASNKTGRKRQKAMDTLKEMGHID